MTVVPGERSRIQLVLALVAFAFVAWFAAAEINARRDEAADDAFITYVYGRNLAEGHGLRYNASDAEPTPGASSLVHVLFSAAAVRARVDPLVATRALGIGCLLWIGALFGLVGARFARASTGAGLITGAWISFGLALLPETGVHLASGMETWLFFALHATALAFVALWLARGGPLGWSASLAVAALLLALALCRPEGAVLALLYVLALASVPGGGIVAGLREQWRLVALVAAGFALVAAWHVATFGVLLPNPYYVKSANAVFGSSGRFFPGAASVLEFTVLRFAPLFACVVALVAAGGVRGEWGRHARLLVPSIVVLVLLARVIHEMAGSFRYELPLLAPLLLLLAVAALELRERSRAAFAGLLLTSAIALPLLATPARSDFLERLAHPRSLAERWLRGEAPTNALAALGQDLAQTDLGQQATILLSGAGQVPWFSRMRAIDWIGLNDTRLSGRYPLSIDEVWKYIEQQKPDLVYSILPPAAGAGSPDAPASEDDANFRTPLVQEFLDGRASELFESWDRRKVSESFRREMSYVRAKYEFGACYKLGKAWRGDWWLFVYVRRESPHREALLAALRASRRADAVSELGKVFPFDPRALGERP